ncbi:hypothetical protein SNEBB_001751 [Seison nebaliae]|nr:hypothetical protein SNEBB_001751 [Seison nebaliae]
MAIEDTLFELKFTAKRLDRMAHKAEKEKHSEERKVKKALGQGNIEGAKIYAENAIRKKHEYLNYLRLSARVDAVGSKVKAGMAMKSITKDIAHVSKALEKAMNSTNLEEVTKIMEKFEKQFEDLDVRSTVMDQTLGGAITMTTPMNEVDALVKEVADENGIEIANQMANLTPAATSEINSTGVSGQTTREDNDLTSRLAALRGN